jgi:hypothetical protein
MTYRRILTTLAILTVIALLVLAWVLVPQIQSVPDDVGEMPASNPCIYIDTTLNYHLKTPWYAGAWVRNRFKYRLQLIYHWNSPRETLREGRGVCIDYATLLCSLLRSEGIDAWVVVGYTSSWSTMKHAWVVSGKYVMDFQRNYLALPKGWKELYRFNEQLVIEKS